MRGQGLAGALPAAEGAVEAVGAMAVPFCGAAAAAGGSSTGLTVVPGCTFTATGESEEELIEKVVAHAKHDHGVGEVTPELAAKVKAAIARQ